MSRSNRAGLSLVEVLVVVGILGILIGLMLPATRRVGEASYRARCMNNLRQLTLALHMYHEMGSQAYDPAIGFPDSPAERFFPPGCVGPGAVPRERLSWLAALLPCVEQEALYKTLNFEEGYAANRPAVETRLNMFHCPSSQESAAGALTNYVAPSGIGKDAAAQPAGAQGNGFMGYDRQTSLTMINDGASNTIALMETTVDLGPWARGGTATVRGFDADAWQHDVPRPFGAHPNAMLVAMADGSVRTVSYNIDPRMLAAALTSAGGEIVDLD